MAHYGVREDDIYHCYLRKVGTKNVDDMLHYISKFGGPQLEEPSSGKSESEAEKFLHEGYDYYRKRNLRVALEMCNSSIRVALHPVLEDSPIAQEGSTNPYTEEYFRFPAVHPSKYGGVDKDATQVLQRSYAFRSHILSDLQLYEQSLENFNLLFECGCPEGSYSKMQARKAKVIEKLKESKNRENQSDRDESCSPESSLRPEDAALRKEILIAEKRTEIPTMRWCNVSTPALSSALRITNIEGKGRGIVATEDILPGEVVAVDRAFAVFTADNDVIAATCATCLHITRTPVPCPGCTRVVFCSRSCRDKGLAEDHWLECKIQTAACKEELKEAVLAGCKMLKSFNHAHIEEMTQKLKNEESFPWRPTIKGFTPAGKYCSNSFRAINYLHCDLENHLAKNLFSLCLASFRVAKMIVVSGRYFVDNGGRAVTPTREKFLDLCKKIVVNVDKMLKNGFACGHRSVVEFSGVFPSVSLFNHSCNPSLGYKSYGRHMVMFCKAPIRAGEEVTISYTDTFSLADFEQRQEDLRHYGFICDCQACKEDWPFHESLPFIQLRCIFCKKPTPDEAFICTECTNSGIVKDPWGVLAREMLDLELTLEFIRSSGESLWRKKESTKQDFNFLSQKIRLLHRNLGGPCEAYYTLLSALDSWF